MKTDELYEVMKQVSEKGARSQWDRGVNEYALEIAEHLKENYETIEKKDLEEACLNGAKTWRQYSEGGCSLIYDADIAERLATKSWIKARTNKRGILSSWCNSGETWLQVQGRALNQAYRKLKEIVVVYDNNW